MQALTWWWIAFIAIFFVVYFVDMYVTDHRKGEISVKTSLRWTGVWISIALLFGAAIFFFFPQNAETTVNTAHEMGMKFIAGYLTEYSLSVDNLFVFIMIFSMMAIASHNQPKLLKMGILISIVLRVLFILLGMELVQQFEWIMIIFGLILVYTAVKMAFSNDEDQVDPKSNILYKGASKIFPIYADEHSSKFFVKENGKTFITVIFLCLLVIGSTDVLFAVDSIPAIIGVIREGASGILTDAEENFLAVSSNVFAVMGLVSLFFALKGIMKMFRFLKHGVCFILLFIGVKMSVLAIPSAFEALAKLFPKLSLFAEHVTEYFLPIEEFFSTHSWVSLAVIIFTLAFSIVLSMLISDEKKIEELREKIAEEEKEIEGLRK
ncbi:MAG: TerC/Alx family metal homeostasis membrane protein [Paludibacter sp.]|jgi:tellurite resistance protein TerC|nr:TerC/Alx family metal homeostasis membrane protein [Paludibacter sp.]